MQVPHAACSYASSCHELASVPDRTSFRTQSNRMDKQSDSPPERQDVCSANGMTRLHLGSKQGFPVLMLRVAGCPA
eukprot:4267961-Amphidinium_carterae.1